MKSALIAICLQRRKLSKGFTLIELLVVVILLGIFAALGLPTLLGQIAKGRQAEARASLGTISRAQQGYRYENGVFASLNLLPVEIQQAKFYTFADNSSVTPDAFGAAYQANALTEFNNEIKNYAGAAGQTAAGTYTGIICEDETPLEDNVSTNNVAGVLNCVNGIRIE
jgi:prepilin-type N-terminal cleavage/methylation domain-containing protein